MARFENLNVNKLNVSTITGGAGLPYTQGTKYFVDPVNGSNSNTGLSPTNAIKSIVEAESRCVANKNDTVFYLASSSATANLTETLVWDKDYTHLIGICAPVGIANRSRVFATGAFSPMINITASGCVFKDLYVFHGIDSASALVNVQVTGSRNYFENVHFAGIGHATQGDQATACSLKLSGASENLFKNCVIGVDTIPRSTSTAELRLASAATRNRFHDCTFLTFADNAGALWIEANTAGAIDRFVEFKNCTFHNAVHSTATPMTVGATVHASVGGTVLLDNPLWYGATNFNADNANVIAGRSPAQDTTAQGLGLKLAQA